MKLLDERISAKQIIASTEWDFGFDVGELQKHWQYPLFKEATKEAIKRLSDAGYGISNIARALNKSRLTIYRNLL